MHLDCLKDSMEDVWDIPEFTPAELETFHSQLRCGVPVPQPMVMGGCHTYLRTADMGYLDTLVTYDGIHFTLGIGTHYGCRVIAKTTPEDMVAWYNTVRGKDVKYVRKEKDSVIVE